MINEKPKRFDEDMKEARDFMFTNGFQNFLEILTLAVNKSKSSTAKQAQLMARVTEMIKHESIPGMVFILAGALSAVFTTYSTMLEFDEMMTELKKAIEADHLAEQQKGETDEEV
jgi:hypothetical protein